MDLEGIRSPILFPLYSCSFDTFSDAASLLYEPEAESGKSYAEYDPEVK